jgi:hypothetical protein
MERQRLPVVFLPEEVAPLLVDIKARVPLGHCFWPPHPRLLLAHIAEAVGEHRKNSFYVSIVYPSRNSVLAALMA